MARKKLQKFFALLLTFSMSMSLLSVGAFAAENDGGEKTQLSSVTLPDDSPAEINVAFGTSEEDLELPDHVLGTVVKQEEEPPVEVLPSPEVTAVEGEGDGTAQTPGSSDDAAQTPDSSDGAAQTPDSSDGAAQTPDSSDGAAQNSGDSGDSGDTAQNPGDSGDSGDVGDAQQDSQENTLSAMDTKMDPAPEDTEDPEEIPVTWICKNGYNGWSAGTYEFTAQLDSHYAYEGPLPTVTVTVAAQAQYVAEINGTQYETLQKAMDAAKEARYNATIKLLGNVLLSSEVQILIAPNDALDLTLDLAGYEIAGAPGATSSNIVMRTLEGATGTFTAKMTVKNGTFSGLHANGNAGGGALSVFDSLTVENCVFQNNYSGTGGAIHLLGNGTTPSTTLTVKDSAFIGNYDSTSGGGAILAVNNETAVFQNVKFIDNASKSAGMGGALNLTHGTVKIDDCTFQGNTSATSGGAVAFSEADVTVKDSTFTGNCASSLMGGAIHIQGPSMPTSSAPYTPGNLDISGCTFRSNRAGYGGAISAANNVTLSLSDSTVSSNSADTSGGAIYTQGICTLNISTDLTSNEAGSIGGAIYSYQGTITMDGDLTSNKAGSNGGAICSYQSTITMDGDLTGNSAGGDGGAIYSIWSTVDLNGTVSGNSATGNGGGIYTAANEFDEAFDGKINLLDASVYNNTADKGGADIWQGSGNQMDLKEVGSDWVLKDCDHAIDGWYDDSPNARWSAHEKPLHAVEFTDFDRGSTTVSGPTYLKAAHGLTPVEPEDPNLPDWEFSKSKTATNLDGNYKSQVTLSLPAAQETLASDVVFVLDKSTSATVEEQMISMLNDLNEQAKATGAAINVGVVIFNKVANTVLPLTELSAENMVAIQKAIKQDISGGTNLNAGLLAGKAMLDADTKVDANRKYLVLVSDGSTYYYCKGEDYATAYTISSRNGGNTGEGGQNEQPNDGLSAWDCKYTQDHVPTWETYFGQVENWLKTDYSKYEYTLDDPKRPSTSDLDSEGSIPYAQRNNYPINVDISLYNSYQLYRSMQASGYHCYAVSAETTSPYKFGPSYMDYLRQGENVSFTDIQNDIYYLLDAGSKVVDVIGYGTDNKGNKYNFDFVDDISALTLTVNGKKLPAREIDVTDAFFTGSYETACYVFGDPSGDSSGYPFALHYYADGEDGQSDECFVWEINVPVSNFAPVQLTYSVKLTDPQTADGTYGSFDADGSEHFDSLLTNLNAALYPVDSNGEQGMPEYFAKPTVSYTNTTPGGGGGGRDDDDGGTKIPDENPPTTDVPGTDIPDENPPTTDVPATDLEDPDVPLADVPKTGDVSALWLALSALSGTGLAGVTFLGRKKRDEE